MLWWMDGRVRLLIDWRISNIIKYGHLNSVSKTSLFTIHFPLFSSSSFTIFSHSIPSHFILFHPIPFSTPLTLPFTSPFIPPSIPPFTLFLITPFIPRLATSFLPFSHPIQKLLISSSSRRKPFLHFFLPLPNPHGRQGQGEKLREENRQCLRTQCCAPPTRKAFQETLRKESDRKMKMKNKIKIMNFIWFFGCLI